MADPMAQPEEPKELTQKFRCQLLLEQWIRILGLGYWDIVVEYVEGYSKARQNLLAMVETHWEYQSAYITVYLSQVAYRSDEELEHDLVHELCHVLVNEMREEDLDDKHEERVATSLASAFLWTWKAGAGKLEVNYRKVV